MSSAHGQRLPDTGNPVQIVRLHAAAPHKPTLGALCNGCGACCASAPCPVSRLLLAHRSGSCPALVWQDSRQRHACGMVVAPIRFQRWLPRPLAPFFSRLIRRWIASGAGCDFDAEVG